MLPWGTYKYLRLPLGVANSQDIFQDKMSDLMIGLEFVRTYLDDLLVITKASFEDHLLKLRLVLQRLSDAGLRVNVSKSNFCQTEIECLGFWITQQGIQPLPNKVEAIKKIARPKNRKELRRFIGLVNYYRDMWRHRSDLLAPLSTMTSKNVRWKWTQDAQGAFDKIKRIVCQDVLLSYPDFSKPFHIYTDASDSQLGAVITQESNRPLAFYSRKLNSAQRRYTTTERELLSIVETLKEFKNILLGQQLVVFTDHKNLIHNTPTTDRVMLWRLLLKEYHPEIKYIKGANNLVAVALSRLATDEDAIVVTPEAEAIAEAFHIEKLSQYLFPLDTKIIAQEQNKDSFIKACLKRGSAHWSIERIDDHAVLTYKNKIFVPSTLRAQVLERYHEMLRHPGVGRTEHTIRLALTWPGMSRDVENHVQHCRQCQLLKKQRKKYGHLPPKKAESQPWHRLCIDLVGPYEVNTPSGKQVLKALTMIDPATSWFEIVEIPNKQAITIAELVDQQWLC
ncbi:MAG: RNase H-like domain-containing protein, partial [Gloeomargaritales cyanobacterium]